jgi:prevent-host-death family protein
MRQASVSQLKATLRECLAWVKAGEEVVVTERGTPIAKIVPLAKPPAALPASLAALAQAGLVTRGSGHVPTGVDASPSQGPRGAGATRAHGGARDRSMKFWDASAIIPLCLEEPWTPWLRQVLAEDTLMIVWWGSMVECWSAFARLRREGLFQTRDEEDARTLLARLATAWTEVLPSQAVRTTPRSPPVASPGQRMAAIGALVVQGSRAAGPSSV